MEFSEETRRDILDYQNIQQQLQLMLLQKQQAQLQLAELDRAKQEVEKSTSSTFFRSVGAILVPKTKAELASDLAADAESIKLRSDFMAKQEERLKSKLSSLQEKLSALESKYASGQKGEGTTISKQKRVS